MMFTTQTSTPTPTLSPSTSTVPSPTRPSRLRGLSYLRNYTHSHLHSRDNSANTSSNSRPFTLTRATSYPSPTSSTNQIHSGPSTPTHRATPTLQRSTIEVPNNNGDSNTPGSTSGWFPIAGGPSAVLSSSAELTEESNMGRTRSGTASREAGSDISQLNGGRDPQLQYGSAPQSGLPHGVERPTIRFSQYQDVRAPRPSLVFSPMGRTLPTGNEVIRVGRYSERETLPNQPANLSTANPVGFKSKVVSRKHCEFWCQDGCWYIKDVKSSSGTFLNHVRLSSPGNESKPFPVKDGDIVQLGIDFKGGEEMIFRCVKIRIELNRAWQNSLNSFNVASHKRLRNMAKQLQSPASSSSTSQDCSICLGAVAPCQSLFVAPCSHTWHYKCVRRIINGPQWPTFVCPNCRAVADLEADVDEPIGDGDWEELDAAEDADASEESHDAEPQSRSVGVASGTEDASTALDRAMERMHIQGSADAQPPSSSSLGPIDISRNNRATSRRQSSDATSGNNGAIPIARNVRTPSPSSRTMPNGLEVLTGAEGPMTPRNDVGPFVFDGSAGQAVEAPMPLHLPLTADKEGISS